MIITLITIDLIIAAAIVLLINDASTTRNRLSEMEYKIENITEGINELLKIIE